MLPKALLSGLAGEGRQRTVKEAHVISSGRNTDKDIPLSMEGDKTATKVSQHVTQSLYVCVCVCVVSLLSTYIGLYIVNKRRVL